MQNKTVEDEIIWNNVLTRTQQFYASRHRRYIENLDNDKDTLEYLMSDHLRMGGAFWGLGALDIMGFLPQQSKRETEINRDNAIRFVVQCWDSRSGGYGSNIGHDAHIASTLYALLVLAMFGALNEAPVESISKWVKSLQNSDGSFSADRWGETDARFAYCAMCILTLVGRVEVIDLVNARQWIMRCRNPDGAFGNIPGAESHAAYVFCCVGALFLLGSLEMIDRVRKILIREDALGQWLSERQISGRCGGFNGRPEKAPDVCYSWWILASLKMIGREHWINSEALIEFILGSQDVEDGGIADRSEDIADVFHTFFGVAGLSLLGAIKELKLVDPVTSLSFDVLNSNGLPVFWSDNQRTSSL